MLHWNLQTDQFNQIDFKKTAGTRGMNFNGINCITHDDYGKIWVGFGAMGIVRYDPLNDSSKIYNIADGLPGNSVNSLQFDNKGRLWIGTEKGLSCFLPTEQKFINFKKEDGLPEDRFTYDCKYYDKGANKLWIATATTLMQFDPDILLSSTRTKFPVYLDEVFINGKKYTDSLFQQVQLEPSQNNVQFNFIAVDLYRGKDIEYSFQLVGADKDWIYSSNYRTASYANLNSGNYTFKVRARHKGDNVWREIQEPVTFHIQTAWNRSWWFILMLAMIISFTIWIIISSYYFRKLEKQKGIIEKQDAISSERSRIAADMHDDMGAGLSRMRYLSAAMKKETSNEKQKEEFDKLIAGSDELVDKMNEIIWTLNSSDESLEDVLYYIRSQCSEMLDHANMEFEYSLPADIPGNIVSSEEKRNIYLLVKEAVHNAIKHSGATRVILSVHTDDRLKISIADNGKGFNIDEKKFNGNGLSNYQKRTEILKGKAILQSGETGTTVSFEIPLF